MTDRIDLDELSGASEEAPERPNRGEWLWGGADDGPAPSSEEGEAADATAGEEPDGRGVADVSGADDAVAGATAPGGATAEDRSDRPVPHVPRPNKDKPVGIPVEGGGADGGPARPGESGPGGEGEPGDATHGGEGASPPGGASGPHGGDADDMTLAFTYAAATRLEDPARALADASRWADWVGIVGDVEAHVINKFQRDHHVDVDFFNGSGTGPGERLAAVDAHSMFFAERMVVVGVEGRDEPVAEAAGWEFVSLATAAEKADWALAE